MDTERLLDPQLRDVLEPTEVSARLRAGLVPESGVADWAAALRGERAAAAAARPSVRPASLIVEDHWAPGASGIPDVRIRVYTHERSGADLRPGLLWIYGGAFMFGTLDEWEDLYLRIAHGVDAVVVGVEYRKAPEDPFPAAVGDCYTALEWVAANASALGIDADQLVVGGGSAGGTFTAALTLMARDRGGPQIAFQMPLFAALDDRLATPSSRSITDARLGANRTQLERVWEHYLGPHRGSEISPYAAPARAPNLMGLPPAYMFVGQLDPMRDENIEYAMRLMEAGVPTELHVYPGAFHGFHNVVPSADVSKRAQSELISILQRALSPRTFSAVLSQ